MPAKDSEWNYTHMAHPHHVLYREKWVNDHLLYDDIDFNYILQQQQARSQFQAVNFLRATILADDDDEDEMNVSMIATQFGATKNHKKFFTNNAWKDLELRNFLDHKGEDHEHVKDNTILKSVDSQAYEHLLSSEDRTSAVLDDNDTGSAAQTDRQILPSVSIQDDLGDVDLTGNEIMMRSNSVDPSVTPLMTRSKKRFFYQTPVTRKLR